MSFILRFAILFASSTLAFSPSWSPAEHVAVDEEPPPAPWIGSLGRMKFAPPAMGSSRDVYTGPCAFISLIVNVPVLLQCLFDRFGSVFPQCGLMVFPGVVIV
ncbi:hypothetical protein, partial [Bifidobacterium longum]|uniref:hypothetical protein n=1 Tax=Bifidobacterium longum TaxID=216816 RepID=UPI001F5FF779